MIAINLLLLAGILYYLIDRGNKWFEYLVKLILLLVLLTGYFYLYSLEPQKGNLSGEIIISIQVLGFLFLSVVGIWYMRYLRVKMIDWLISCKPKQKIDKNYIFYNDKEYGSSVNGVLFLIALTLIVNIIIELLTIMWG